MEIFDREFVESQEELGMAILGQFGDLDNPDRFVWVRGFGSMALRGEALPAFYGGPVWKEHAAAANATMVDSDNVLLLRAVSPLPALGPRAPVGAAAPASVVVVSIRYGDRPFEPEPPSWRPEPWWSLRTEYAANNFPALPVRTGVHASVAFDRFESLAEASAHPARGAGERLMLAPAGRSLLR
jgi:hypothetical protein